MAAGHPIPRVCQRHLDKITTWFQYGSILEPRGTTMPNLSIKNVPAEVVAGLRERASVNHRSLQGELLALVSQAAVGAVPTVASEPFQGVRTGHKSMEQIAAEHRQQIKRPVSNGPRSTELIRQERDAR